MKRFRKIVQEQLWGKLRNTSESENFREISQKYEYSPPFIDYLIEKCYISDVVLKAYT
ncbi:hypothetical protein FZC77_12635 [Bacillus swezeyi]|uniref:Uncharacterized protein n=1 Tax=Bacillus swezeyi TaxID=1925020 RepID=A0A5M8RVZ2_9BACI|nr:hypothetical protein DX927_13160 [Bacillus swezeyi]TYS35895.1 hypothetical protein FZC77_12635 [Bacillus swezeyi]